jgi:hypothetical protein
MSEPRIRRHRAHCAAGGLAVPLTWLVAALGACGNHVSVQEPTARDAARGTPRATERQRPAREPFAGADVWSAPLTVDAPVDPRSDALVGTLLASVRAQMRDGTGPALSAAARAPVYTVAGNVDRVPVKLDRGPPAGPLRRELARGVPISRNALPSRGSDAAMVIWQPSSDTMWEFFQAQQALHAPPWIGSPTASSGGGLAPGGYRYAVTALNAEGETTPNTPSALAQVAGAGGRIEIRWESIDDATGYKVYRDSASTGMRRLVTLSAASTRYVDTGARAADASAPPLENSATTPGQWRAANAGVLHAVSTGPGHYRDLRKRDGGFLERFNWGASATSLPLAAGMITKADLEQGHIDHALAIGLPNLSESTSIIAAGRWAFPAQRADGKSTLPDAIPEGARFRLDPRLDLDSLQLSPLTRMLAEAVQRYGMIVQDGAPATVFYGEDPGPYIRAGEPNFYDTLAGRRHPGFLDEFPWQHLRLLDATICTDATIPCTRTGQR